MDQSEFVLHGVRLKPHLGESRVVSVEDYTPPELMRPKSALLAMRALTAVDCSADIGKNGPANASNSDEKQKGPHQGHYDVFFPRDAHIVARFLATDYPALTRATVIESLRHMGKVDNYSSPTHPYDEQEVGKIPHEIRSNDDEIAKRLTELKDWGWPYYGAVDTTGKNIIAIGNVLSHDDSDEFLDETYAEADGTSHTIREGLWANVDWLCKRMDMNPEGFVESLWQNKKHHPNQTWADSTEAFHHADGSWAQHHPEQNLGVAAIEQQAEAYDALLVAAEIAVFEGDDKKSEQLYDRALRLQRAVLDVFWVDDESKFGGYFAQGTDRDENGNPRPLAVRSSDMGNILNSNILLPIGDGELDDELARKRDAIIRNLFSSDMLSPSGIRTKSKDSLRYDDDRYHGGNSWPWVTAYIADGLIRHGFPGLADELNSRVLDTYIDTKMFGEFVSGSEDRSKRIIDQKVTVKSETNPFEREYPISQPAQEVQAWTAAAVLKIKKANSPFAKPTLLVATDPAKRKLETEILDSIAW